MIRTSLDATIAAALCFAFTAPQTTTQTAVPRKPTAAPAQRSTPTHPVTPQTQRQPVTGGVPLQRSAPISARPAVTRQPAETRLNAPPAPVQQRTQPYLAPVQPAQRPHDYTGVQPARPNYQAGPGQRLYQLPASGPQYQIPSGATGARYAGATGSYGPSSPRHYTASRPVPAYSTSQIRGFQAQALRPSGPGASMAAMRMGDIYTAGTAQPADPVRAARWYAYSTHMGNASSAYSLGQLYLAGQGVPLDPTRGYALITWAGQNGDPDAQGYLASNPAPPLDPTMANAPLPPPPPPPSTAPADNANTDGSDIIGDILLGTVALGVLAVALGSNPSDASQAPSDHGGSLEVCAKTDDLGRLLGYDTGGIAVQVKGCVH